MNYRPTFGTFVGPDGDLVVKELPIDWVTALPASGDFPGHLFYNTTSQQYFYWNGSSFIGPLGTGGGGGAPATAQYVVLALDGTLTSERVLTAGAAISIVDGGANGNVTVSVPDNAITDAKLRDSAARSVIGRTAASAGDPADIAAGSGTEHCLRENGAGSIGFGQLGTGGIEDFAVETAKLDNNAVTNAKLNDMPANTIKGRQSGTGDPQDLTAAQVLGIIGVAATPTGTGFVHITAGVQDAAAKLVDTADVNANQITDALLRDSTALSVIGRAANSSGDPADIAATAASGAVLRESGSTIGFGTVATAGIADDAVTDAKLSNMAQGRVKGRAPAAGTGDPTDLVLSQTPGTSRVPWVGASGTLDKEWIEPHSAVGAFVTSAGGGCVWANAGGAASLEFIVKATDTQPIFTRFAHTAFPGTPVNGQRCYRTDMQCYFYFDSVAAGWLSFDVFEFEFGIDADLSATAFLKTGELSGHATFSSTIGHIIGVACKIVGLSLNMDASGTATIQVTDDGSGVTGATLALSAQQSKADVLLFSSTIAANSILGVQVTSGTVQGPARGRIRARRFET